MKPKFKLGRLLVTPGALEALHLADLSNSLLRHASGDWGLVTEEVHWDNESGLKRSHRLHSKYRDRAGQLFWIITEGDRSVTTILLPEDY